MIAYEGKLVGKPDLLVDDEIRDYKSGSIFELAEDGSQQVKDGYLRQLRIYGHLVHETTGKCPPQGKLLPMSGREHAVELSPEACKSEAESAIVLLDDLNDKLSQNREDTSAIGTPSPKACKWCGFKSVCPAFWNAVSSDWAKELGSGAIKGTVTQLPSRIHDGKAWSLSIQSAQGTIRDTEMTILPLPSSVHSLAEVSQGDQIRAINLYHRADESLAPTQATVILKESKIPKIVFDEQT
jgi:hypothetical protein